MEGLAHSFVSSHVFCLMFASFEVSFLTRPVKKKCIPTLLIVYWHRPNDDSWMVKVPAENSGWRWQRFLTCVCLKNGEFDIFIQFRGMKFYCQEECHFIYQLISLDSQSSLALCQVNSLFRWSELILTVVDRNALKIQGKKVCKVTAVRCLFVFVCWHRGEAIKSNGYQQKK